jgi:hypothetical protein
MVKKIISSFWLFELPRARMSIVSILICVFHLEVTRIIP